MSVDLVLPLEKAMDVSLCGGKARALGQLINAGFNVPPGFVITTHAETKMDKSLEDEILRYFDNFNTPYVAVRSSAVGEDSSTASWAGQLESYLNVDKTGLIDAIKKCWASIESERAISYAKEHDVPQSELKVGVVVQKMINSDTAGVMFTVNPVNQLSEEIVIEAIYGLGELLVQGLVTPDTFVVEKSSGAVKHYDHHRQKSYLIFKDGKNRKTALPQDKKSARVLGGGQIKSLAKLARQTEKHYKFPQDVEWAIEDGQIYIVQSRPITTLVPQQTADLPEFFRHCVLTIARPGSMQRDEIVRYSANAIVPVQVATIPFEGNNRGYYFEAEDAKKLLGKSMAMVDSADKLKINLEAYISLKKEALQLVKLVEQNPRSYKEILKTYRTFLTNLSPFLYVGVAVDKIIYPNFKVTIEKLYASQSEKVLEAVATPKDFHDYQKMRLALCKIVLKDDSKSCEADIKKLVDDFRHVNEYTFVEPLLTAEAAKKELVAINDKQAQAELHDIENSIDKSSQINDFLRSVISDRTLLNQAFLIREYGLLRTDRIDRLKLVQSRLRATFKEIAKDMLQLDGNAWTKDHVANLLDIEIDDFIAEQKIPEFKAIEQRLDQKYLYYYTDGKATVITDSNIVERARKIITKPAITGQNSLISPGTVAYKGTAKGSVIKIMNVKDLKRMHEGAIMVARVTMPDYTPYMKQAAGFITAEGGITSHAAIVARELKKPCIVGSQNCMDVLQEDDKIVLDATNQVVTRQKNGAR